MMRILVLEPYQSGEMDVGINTVSATLLSIKPRN